jgi:type II secretory pathway component PulF
MAKKTNKNVLEKEIYIGGISLVQKAIFARYLAVMLKSGLTIIESLEIAVDSAQGRLKKIIRGVLEAVKSGYSLAFALERYPKVFSKLFTNAVYAGETSGTLDESLERVADQLDKEREIFSKIKGAMIYPTIILVASFILGVGMTFWVLPKITPLFEGLKVELPLTTQLLIKFSSFVQVHGAAFFVSVVVFISILIWLLKQNFLKPFTHLVILKIPVVNRISKNANVARFSRSLSVLLKSGLNIYEALKIVTEMTDNHYYKKILQKASESTSKGSKLSSDLALHRNLFPVMTTKMIRVGEESGKLEDTLAYLADFYEREVDDSLKSLSVYIEPALLIFIGLIVAFMALSIITPIYSITSGMGR